MHIALIGENADLDIIISVSSYHEMHISFLDKKLSFLLLNKTDNLLIETQKSNVGLDALVNRIDQLIKTQVCTSLNISQQTIMKEYSDQVPFKVAISYCNDEAFDNDIAYSTIVLDKNGDPTTLKFMLTNIFRFYTLPNDNGTLATGETLSLGNDSNPELINPIEEKLHKLQISTILNQTKNTNDTYLFIRSAYDFAPYSEVTGNLITKYVHNSTGQQMIEFKKNDNGN